MAHMRWRWQVEMLKKWLIVTDAKWKQSSEIDVVRGEGWVVEYYWIKGLFSVWRWGGDEGCSSSIKDDS